MKIIDQITFASFTINMRADSIIHAHISGEPYTVKDLKDLVPMIGRLTNYKALPMLITSDEKASPDAEARAFWSHKDSCPYLSAEAYIVNNFAHRLIGKIYLKFNNPERPTNLFVSEEEAYGWLKKFLDKH